MALSPYLWLNIAELLSPKFAFGMRLALKAAIVFDENLLIRFRVFYCCPK